VSSSPWLVSWHPAPDRLPVLLCLPPAGAGCGQYRSWQAVLAPDVAVLGVQLPGREERWDDPPATDVDEVVAQVAAALTARLHPGAPFAVFGHSFGGLLGHEIVHRLRQAHGLSAAALVVAACRPPHHWLGAGRGLVDDRAELDRLLAERDLDTDDLDEDSREEMLEVLRQDARLSLTYRLPQRPRLDCPVEAWGGADDTTVTAPQLDGWAAYTDGPFRRRAFPGGHYFCLEHTDALLPLLAARLHGPDTGKEGAA
jgi:surfactin synthase thioesterase subunit